MQRKIKAPLVAGACGLLLSAGTALAAVTTDTMTVNVTVKNEETASGDPSASDSQTATVGVLGKRDVLNTPYSVHSVPESIITRQQVKSVKDVYKYLPSVQGDGARPQTRGIQGSVVQNSMIDGVRWI
jgi:iron complex outermembrane receptor protein